MHLRRRPRRFAGRKAEIMTVPNTPLFVKTHDFIVWLLEHTQRFRKGLRQSYTTRLENEAFEFQKATLMANAVRGPERHAWLDRADGHLTCLRALLRFTSDFRLLGANQIRYAVERVEELGRLFTRNVTLRWVPGGGAGGGVEAEEDA
jgi:hypothetical protein